MRYTTESFIETAKSIHGDKYDYQKVIYKNIKTKVQIICPIHGVFEQVPEKHLYDKCGCPSCAGNQKNTTASFVQKAQLVHGNIYDYTHVRYVNNKTPVEIVCSVHGVFQQLPGNHLQGNGCPFCANNVRLSTEQFVEKAKGVHGDKYDYTNVQYCGNRRPVIIKCPLHGEFEQVPYAHLSGQGCPVCGMEMSHQHRDGKQAYETARQTFLDKYGVENPMAVPAIRQKQLDKVRSAEVNEKRNNTKRQNGSFNTSLSEYRLGGLLRAQFGADDIFDNYESDVYPYKCDFYIKSRDLYIELNAHWSHGGHWFDAMCDQDTIIDWMGKSAFYQNAAQTFSQRDVMKRNTARLNKLNYVVFWHADLSDAKKWFELGCPDGQDWAKEYSWIK